MSPDSGPYPVGLEFALVATPAPYFTFAGWRGDLVATENPVLISLTGDRMVEAELGNFGAAAVSADESWVTVSEGMFMKDCRARGAEGATFVTRIKWSKPNRLFQAPSP